MSKEKLKRHLVNRILADKYVKEVISQYNPKFKVRYKKNSKLFKFFSPIIKIVNPRFFTSYVTVMFGTMWVPDNFFNQDSRDMLKTMAHEGIHEHDRSKLKYGLFELIYMFPQDLMPLFLLLAVFVNWWFLVPAIVVLGPLPAYGRFKLEMRGYYANKLWQKHVWVGEDWYGVFSDNNVVKQMTSVRTYWGCWPFEKHVRKLLKKPMNETKPVFVEPVEFMKRHGVI